MFGDAQAIVNGSAGCLRIHAGRFANLFGIAAEPVGHGFRGVLRVPDEFQPLVEFFSIATLGNVIPVGQVLGDDGVAKSIDERHIAARGQWDVYIRADVRRFNEVDLARVAHDQVGTIVTQALLHARREYRVGIGGIGADQKDQVGMFHRPEILGASRGAEGLLQAVTSG